MADPVLEFIKKVQSISQIGLSFSTDPYAIDNYEELKTLSVEMLQNYTGLDTAVCDLYKDYKYPTPQPAVRAMVIKDNQILFVKEKDSGLWSLPGGWCDIDHTPKQSAEKETFEEAGYIVECKKLLGIFDRRNYCEKSIFDVYCMYFYATIVSGEAKCNHETDEVAWFNIDELPPLSRKNSVAEIKKAYEVYESNLEAYYE